MGAEENYKALRAELDERLSSNKQLAAIAEKISAGKADFSDTARYSQIVSHIMGDVIFEYIGEITMPLGKEYVCKELLKDHYKAINDILGKVQASVDDKLGIHLKPVKAPFPTERVDKAAHSLEDPTVPEETIKRRARSATENIANSMHDDYIKENAKTRSQAGLDCYLVRDAGGGCCKWCQALDGKYPYATAPDDIFRRHDNCKCNVTYICGKKRQQVWSKQDWSNNKEREYLKRLDAEKAAKRKALSDNSKPKVNSKEQAEAINEPSKNNITVLSKEQAEALNKQSQPVKFTQAEAKEREAKALGKDDNVNNLSLEKQDESDIMNIVGLTKINDKHQVVNPMNASQYYRMKANLERKGCSVISAKGDDERYLIAFNSEAITDEKGIMHLGDIPSASAFFEETIHYTQIQKYGVLDSTDFIERDAREVAANRKLLKNGKQYGFTQEDYDDVKNNLDFWEKDFKERVGVSYDESDLNREV